MGCQKTLSLTGCHSSFHECGMTLSRNWGLRWIWCPAIPHSPSGACQLRNRTMLLLPTALINKATGLSISCGLNMDRIHSVIPWLTWLPSSMWWATSLHCSHGTPTEVPAVNDWFQRSEQVWENARQWLEHIVETCKRFADQHCSKAPQYRPGDRVWHSMKYIRTLQGDKNLNMCYIGPFHIRNRLTQSLTVSSCHHSATLTLLSMFLFWSQSFWKQSCCFF